MDDGSDARRYRILDEVGRGGFGTVYRGQALGAGGFSKEVALKVLRPGLETKPEQLQRLRDEARLLALLQHKAIVAVDTLTRIHDRWTVVMEYVPGATVRDLLERFGPLPLPMALQIAEHVAGALHAAYAVPGPDGQPLRLLHRDVKPSNVQVTRWGEVRLLDFGIARAEMEPDPRGGVVYGSVPYLAPERLELRDTHQADVYALALTLVQAVTGTLPATGLASDERIAVARRALEEVAAPEQLRDLVTRALAADPLDRPDARQFEHELKRVQRLFTVFDPREWAEEHVGPLLDERRPHAGELTGMVFTEGTAADNLLDLVGTKAPRTFDDPSHPPPPEAHELPPSEPTPPPPEVPVPGPPPAPPTVPPADPPPPRPALPPERRSWAGPLAVVAVLALVGVGGATALGVVAVAVAATALWIATGAP